LAEFSGADSNDKGLVEQADYELRKYRFGLTAGSGSMSIATVPEPSTISLLIMSAASLRLRRSRAA
jgi:hypothetical protein